MACGQPVFDVLAGLLEPSSVTSTVFESSSLALEADLFDSFRCLIFTYILPTNGTALALQHSMLMSIINFFDPSSASVVALRRHTVIWRYTSGYMSFRYGNGKCMLDSDFTETLLGSFATVLEDMRFHITFVYNLGLSLFSCLFAITASVGSSVLVCMILLLNPPMSVYFTCYSSR